MKPNEVSLFSLYFPRKTQQTSNQATKKPTAERPKVTKTNGGYRTGVLTLWSHAANWTDNKCIFLSNDWDYERPL